MEVPLYLSKSYKDNTDFGYAPQATSVANVMLPSYVTMVHLPKVGTNIVHYY